MSCCKSSFFVAMASWSLVGLSLTPLQAQDDEPYLRRLSGMWMIEAVATSATQDDITSTTTDMSVPLPASWEVLVESAGSTHFRMTRQVEFGPEDPLADAEAVLGIWLGAGGTSSCRLLLDGHPQATFGEVDAPLPMGRPQLIRLDPELANRFSFELGFECQQPTFLPSHQRQQKPFGEVLLGDLGTLQQENEKRFLEATSQRFPWLTLPFFLLAVGAYHLHLFGRRQGSPEYLWFGFLAVDLALVVFFDGWATELPLPLAVSKRLLEAGSHGLLVLLLSFLGTFLARPKSRLIHIYQASHVFCALWVLLIPGYVWVLRSDFVRHLWGVPGWIYLASFLVVAIRRGRGEARLVSLGGLAVVISGLFAWLFHLSGASTGYGLLPWSFVLFTLTMATALARRFRKAHNEIDRLRLQLEEMVEDRTNELSAANDRLKAEIAERQLAEEAMRMLERAVEQSIDGVLVVDLEGRAQFVNQAWAQMHDCEVFEVLGQRLSAFHTPEQMSEEIEPRLQQVLAEGVFEGEVGHLRKDGQTFPAWTSISLLRDGPGEPVGFVAVGRDVSTARRAEDERHHLEQKIQHSRKLESLGNLASGLAHDYNNLLTGVLGNVSLLRRTLAPGVLLEKLSQVEAAAERAVDLTSQLRSYAGEDTLLLASEDTNSLLRRMGGELQRLVGGSAQIDFELSEDLPPALLDASQMRHLMRNLVSNAAEAISGSDGRIVVKTSIEKAGRGTFMDSVFDMGQPSGDYLCLSVEDNGMGIPEGIQHKIFDPFFSTRPSARGLGLAIVLGIVRTHGGAVRVLSSPGEGTGLSVLLPLTTTVDVCEESAKQETAWVGSGRILVVDDQELMREVSSSILEAQGFEVLTASTGTEAVHLFEENSSSIRLVLLDRTMPGMDGEEVLSNIRQIDPSTAVILMSGYKERDALRGLDPDHLSGFLAKPFRPSDLLRELKRALGAEESDR